MHKKTFRWAGVLAPIMLAMCHASPVTPQEQAPAPRCSPHAAKIEQFKQQFGEEVVAQGVTNGGAAFMELLASPNGTWTLFMTRPDGNACTITFGDSFNFIPPTPPGEPA